MACLVALTVGALIAFSDVVAPDRLLYNRDHGWVFRPAWSAFAGAIEKGKLPALTRFDPSGAPLEATPLGMYTPLGLFPLLGDLERDYDWWVLGHIVLLGIGVFFLARSLGAGPVGALGAAVVASFSGPVLSFENLVAGLIGIAYAPWVYLGFVLLVRNPGLLSVGFQALALGFHLQAPEPTLSLLDLVALAALLIVLRPRPTPRLVLAMASALVLGLAIASITLGPVLEILPQTRRGSGFSYEEASQWSLRWPHFVELIAPSFWNPPDALFINAPRISGNPQGPYLYSLYFGTVLPIAVAALFDPKARRVKIALFALIVVALLLSLGPATPIHRLLWHLPILRSGRYPVKAMVLLSAGIAALVPFALDATARRPRVLLISSVVLLATTFGLAQVVTAPEFSAFLGSELRPHPELHHRGMDAASAVAVAIGGMERRLWHAIGFAIALLIVASVLAYRDRRGVATPWAAALLIALLLCDLSFAGRLAIFGVPADDVRAPDLAGKIGELDRVYPLLPNGVGTEIAHRPGATYTEDYIRSRARRGNYLRELRRFEQFDRNGASNPRAVLAFSLLTRSTGQAAQLILARAGVAWISSWIKVPGLPVAFDLLVEDEKPEHFMPVPERRPYARAYTSWRQLDRSNGSELVAFLGDPDRLHEAAIISLDGTPAPIPTSTSACEGTATASVAPSADEEQIEIAYRGDCPALVVALESVVPGWVVTVDGERQPLIEAELGYLGVWVPAGDHAVRFHYRARVDRWAPIALVAFVVALILIAVAAAQRVGKK
jgi:hypothetical protein